MSRHGKTLVWFSVCVGCLVFLPVCGPLPGTGFQVIAPVGGATNSQEFEIVDNRIRITVSFREAVDLESFLPGINVILDTDRVANAPIEIEPGPVFPLEINITSEGTLNDLLDLAPGGNFSLRLIGTGANALQSTAGNVLDGDGDGNPGGDYETSFTFVS